MSELNCDFCGQKLVKNCFLMLPCGFLLCSEHISEIVQSQSCIVCKNHDLDIDKFLNMAVNKMVLEESKLKQKKIELNASFSFLRSIRTDPQFYISGHFQNLKNQLDRRRTELKKAILNQLDEFYDELIDNLQENYEKYLNEIKLKLKDIDIENESLEEDNGEKLNIKDRLEYIENKLVEFGHKIMLNNLIKFDLDQFKFLNFFKGSYDIRQIFGRLENQKLINIKNFECVRALHLHANQVFCIDELDSGEIVTSSKDKTIKIWDIYSVNCSRTLSGHTNWVLQFKILNKNEIVSCSGDGTIRKWNIKSGDCLSKI